MFGFLSGYLGAEMTLEANGLVVNIISPKKLHVL